MKRSQLEQLHRVAEDPYQHLIRRLSSKDTRELRGPDVEQAAVRIVTNFFGRSVESKEGYAYEKIILDIAGHMKGAVKAPEGLFPGIDMFHTPDGVTLEAWGIKTGKNWGNTSQRSQLITDLHAARRTLSGQWRRGPVHMFNGVVFGPGQTRAIYARGGSEPVYTEHVGKDFFHHLFGQDDVEQRINRVIRASQLADDPEMEAAFTQAARKVAGWVRYHTGCDNDEGYDWDVFCGLVRGDITPEQASHCNTLF